MKTLPLYGCYADGQHVQVDDEDHDWLSQTRWYLSHNGYAFGTPAGRTTLLHRLLMDAPPHLVIDHINGDKLDCRRENMRVCTRSQNRANCRRRKDSTLPYKGIERSRFGTFRASIQVDGREYRSPYAPTVEEAAQAYDHLARRHFGEFARTNFVPVAATVTTSWKS